MTLRILGNLAYPSGSTVQGDGKPEKVTTGNQKAADLRVRTCREPRKLEV